MNFKERRDAKTEVTFSGGDPIIYVTPVALDKMAWYVQGCDKEIGWLGYAERLENNIFIIHDVYLFKQEVHSTTCEINSDGLSEFATELLTQDSENAMVVLNNLRLWGHSHVNMGVSPSGQDETQINVFKDANPWFIRVIANKSGEMEFSIFDFEQGIKFKNVKWMEYRATQITLEEAIKAEIKAKVTTKTYATSTTYYGGKSYNHVTKEWESNEKKTTEQKGTKIVDVTRGKARNRYEDDYEDLYAKYKSGKYLDVVEIERDKQGAITEKFIETNFTEIDIYDISVCETIAEAGMLLDEIDEFNVYTGLDVMNIYDYAQNKYPK